VQQGVQKNFPQGKSINVSLLFLKNLDYFRTKLIMGKRNDNGQLIADKLVIKLSLNACAMEDI